MRRLSMTSILLYCYQKKVGRLEVPLWSSGHYLSAATIVVLKLGRFLGCKPQPLLVHLLRIWSTWSTWRCWSTCASSSTCCCGSTCSGTSRASSGSSGSPPGPPPISLQGLAIAVGALLAISKIPAIRIVVVVKAIASRDFRSLSMFDFLLVSILAIVICYY